MGVINNWFKGKDKQQKKFENIYESKEYFELRNTMQASSTTKHIVEVLLQELWTPDLGSWAFEDGFDIWFYKSRIHILEHSGHQDSWPCPDITLSFEDLGIKSLPSYQHIGALRDIVETEILTMLKKYENDPICSVNRFFHCRKIDDPNYSDSWKKSRHPIHSTKTVNNGPFRYTEAVTTWVSRGGIALNIKSTKRPVAKELKILKEW